MGAGGDGRQQQPRSAGVAGLRRHVLWLAVALIAVGALEVVAFLTQRSAQRTEEHGREIARVARSGLVAALERDRAAHEFLASGGRAGTAQGQRAGARLDSVVDSLLVLTRDDPEQEERAQAIGAAVSAWDIGFASPALSGSLQAARGPVGTSEADSHDEELFNPVRFAFGEFLTAAGVSYENGRLNSDRTALFVLGALMIPAALLAGLVVGLGRRHARQADALSEQQHLLEEQAVELEQQVQELEVSNTELAEALRAEEVARGSAAFEGAERRRNAALLAAALATTPIGLALLDRDLRYLLVNGAMAAMTGLPPDAHVGRTLREVVPTLAPEVEAALQRVLDTREPLKRLDIEQPPTGGAPGRVRHYLLRAAPVLADDGTPTGIGLAVVDETEHREMEEQFQQAQKLEAVGRLASGIAHDFNNLLTIIRSYCDLVLLEMPEDAPFSSEIREIQSAGKRAAALVRQMLAFGRKQAIIPRALIMADALHEMEPMLLRITGADVELRLECDSPGTRTWLDPTQLEQVVLNLAINAVDAMPNGGTLRVRAAAVDIDARQATRLVGLTPGPHVELAVSDTGIGMTADVVRQVFEPFFTTKPEGKGTGLGLASVYGIVRSAGGQVSVESVLGQGTTFRLFLPGAEPTGANAAAAEAARGAAATTAAVAEPRAGGSEVILLVEDEDILRATIARILRRRGYTVIEAAHGGEALLASAPADQQIHMVLSDFNIPGVHGRDLVDRLHEQRPGLRVLFMSGSPEVGDGPAGPGLAPFPFIGKPFTLDGLTRKVRAVLDA